MSEEKKEHTEETGSSQGSNLDKPTEDIKKTPESTDTGQVKGEKQEDKPTKESENSPSQETKQSDQPDDKNDQENNQETEAKDKEEKQYSEPGQPASEQNKGQSEKETHPKKQEKKSDSIVYYAVILLLLIIAGVIYIPRFFEPKVYTLDDLHLMNIQGKLSPEEGYMYNGFSFVKYDDLWYTQVVSENQSAVYSIPFHFGPKEVEYIQPQGQLNKSNLNNYKNFFMTFDPTDEDLGYIAVAIGESNRMFIEAFGKGVIAACTNKEDPACENRPIVLCNSTSAPVFYYASEDETSLIYLNNCAIMSGRQDEIFKATDRMLLDLLGVFE